MDTPRVVAQRSLTEHEEITMMEYGRQYTKTDFKKRCANLDDFVSFLVDELVNAASSKTDIDRENLVFYQVVRGGNVSAVQRVLKKLKDQNMISELAWTVGHPTITVSHRSKLIRARNGLICVLLSIFFVILNPFFYVLHSLAKMLFDRLSGRLTDKIELPLVFAVLSENKNMVKLFVEYGSSISNIDESGNNIFHFLADLSLDSPNQAVIYHHILTSCVDDAGFLRRSYLSHRNQLNLTPLEYAAKYGSITLITDLMQSGIYVREPSITVSTETVMVHADKCVYDINFSEDQMNHTPDPVGDNRTNDKPVVRCFDMDIALYERGDAFGLQSYPLNLICKRSILLLSETDAHTIVKSRFVNKWMSLKYKNYLIYCIAAQIIPFLVTFLIFLYESTINGEAEDLFSDFARKIKHVTMNETLRHQILLNSCLWNKSEQTVQGIFTCKLCIYEDGQLMYGLKHCHTLSILVGLVSVLLIFDVITRLSFVLQNLNFKARKVSQVVAPVIGRLIPGSYAEKQLGLLMYFVFLITMGIAIHVRFQTLHLINQPGVPFTFTAAEIKRHRKYLMATKIMFMCCLVLRAFSAIHVLRLFPGIGFFIITTKRMSSELLKFCIVFLVILVAFAAIFRFILGGPLTNDDDVFTKYKSLDKSFFSILMFAFNDADAETFDSSTNSRIVYTVFSVFIGVMLLNLIVAIMTTTATCLYASPYKQAVFKVEMWQEILGTEAQTLLILWPFQTFMKFLKYVVCLEQWTAKGKLNVHQSAHKIKMMFYKSNISNNKMANSV